MLRTFASHPSPPAPSIGADVLRFSDRGLQVGATHLAPRPILARSFDDPGQLSLRLAIAFRRRLPPHLVRHVVDAAALSLRGDHLLANLRLVFADLARVPAPIDLGTRLAMAETLIEAGMTPGELLDALEPDDEGLAKYDPDQPRVPSGSPGGGQWTDGEVNASTATGATAGVVAAVAAAPEAAETGGLLAAGLGAGTLAALSGLAASVGFGAVFGTLFVPSPNDVSSTGSLPGDPNTTYDYNHDEGVLRLRDAAGNVLAAGHKDASGVFVDAETGVPFARELDGALMFDAAAMARAKGEDDAEAVPRASSSARDEADEPKLCPAASKDVPHGASDRAIAYQAQVSAFNNPGDPPLAPGLAVSLPNPDGGRRVVYDDCRKRDGTMIEAKGPGYEKMFRSTYLERVLNGRFDRQASRQSKAAVGRDVAWYFAESSVADRARNRFDRSENLSRIQTYHLDALIKCGVMA